MVHKYSELDLMQARIKEVPNGWSFLPIAKAFKIRNDLRKPISDEIRCTQQGIYPYYGPTKIQDYIDTYEQDGSFALIGEDGDHFLKYRSQSMTQLVDGKCTVNNHAHIIEGTDLASREWFYYYFMHRDIYSYLSRQGAGRYKLNKASLEKIYVLIPPSEEQNKIAQILSTWDQAILTTEKLLENSQRQKKALMQQLLAGEKRLLDENGVRFSGDWKLSPLNKLTKIYDGTHSTPSYVENGIPFYSVEHLTSNDFTRTKFISESVFEQENKRVKLEKNDILMTRIGDIGTCKVLNWDVKASFYVSLALIKKSEKFNSDFLSFYMNSQEFQAELWKRTIHVAFPKKINLGEIGNCLIRLPSVEEQRKISEFFLLADQEIETLQKKLDCLKQEKKSLMQQLLTGKKRVKVAA